MNNNLTKEEIINSVEYQWRKRQIKVYLSIFIIISLLTLFIPIIIGINDFSALIISLIVWIIMMLFYGVIFACFIFYSALKIKYLLRNFNKFSVYEVELNSISTSYIYRGSVYYTVEVESHKVNTNPIFSSSYFSKFTLKEYNNQVVIGLYDDKLDKFYIIKKR